MIDLLFWTFQRIDVEAVPFFWLSRPRRTHTYFFVIRISAHLWHLLKKFSDENWFIKELCKFLVYIKNLSRGTVSLKLRKKYS